MKQFYLFAILFVIFSCKSRDETNNNIHSEKMNQDSIESSSNLNNESLNVQAYLRSSLELGETLHTEKNCNFLQQHILATNFSANQDSLVQAVEILVDSLWNSIPFSDKCVKNIRCGVYLYKERSDFELDGIRSWFAMGTKITGESAKVRIN